jgi:hypothetical protein
MNWIDRYHKTKIQFTILVLVYFLIIIFKCGFLEALAASLLLATQVVYICFGVGDVEP